VKFIVFANLFSGLNGVVHENKIINEGSPAYFNLINYLKNNKKYELYFLRTTVSDQKKYINEIYIKDLNKKIKIIRGLNFFYKKKFGFIPNKIFMYAIIFYKSKLFNKDNIFYIDRDNILLSFLLSVLGKKSVVRFLGVNNNFYAYLSKSGLYAKIIQYVFKSKDVIKFFTKDGSYSELCVHYPNSYLFFNGIEKNNIQKNNPEKKIVVSYVGRLEKYKGQRELLKAINNCKKMDIHVNLIGDGSDRGYLQDYINCNGLKNMVTITGKVDQKNVFKYLSKSNLFISINKLGIYGNTLLEASKYRLPIIALDHEYFNEVNKKFVYLIKQENIVENLSKAIIFFYNNPLNLDLYSKKSIRFYKGLVSWEERLDKEFAIINKFMKNKEE